MNFAVYGSLRRSMPNDHLWSAVGHSLPCEIPGIALYDVNGPFPYAVEGGVDDVAVGDLITVEHPGDAREVLRTLDILEGVSSEHFERHERSVLLPDGDWRTAWVYLAHPRLAHVIATHGTIIPSGDWVRHLHAHLVTA